MDKGQSLKSAGPFFHKIGNIVLAASSASTKSAAETMFGVVNCLTIELKTEVILYGNLWMIS